MDDSIKKRIAKKLLYHAAACIVLLFLITIYRCPFRYLFGFPCPGCGITRAYIAALHFDFKTAFEYHPLFFTVAPLIGYTAHRNKLKKRLSGKTESILLFVVIALFIGVYFFRLLNRMFTV